jgi:predicted nuclease of predicted toxin-antitoxin system
MKLLVDMNLSPRWIPFLRDAGWEATHWSTVGKADASDLEIMTFAAANGYVVLTNDLDFAAILAASHHKKPSVAQIRAQDLSPNVIGAQIVAALRHVQTELEAGALLTIESDRTRLRILPFEKEP